MNRSTRILLLLAALLVLFAASFLLLEFRFQRAALAVDRTASTYSFSVDEETPLPLEQELDLYVDAPPELESALAEALADTLGDNPYVNNINLREAAPAAAEDSVLAVEIDEPSVFFWSPFYARTVMTVDVAYASDGEVAWIDQDVVRLRSGEEAEPVARMRAEYAFDGSAYGLISGPGYVDYLAGEVAQTVNQSLADSLANAGSIPVGGAR